MKIFRSIRIPDKVRSGDPIKADDHNAVIEALRAIVTRVSQITLQPSADIGVRTQNNSGTTAFLKRRPRGGSSITPPFHVRLIRGGTTEEPVYQVTVAPGWVNERITGTSDPAAPAVAVFEPYNRRWGEDAVDPDKPEDARKFTLAIGQQVSVIVYVDGEGGIGGDDAPAGGPVEIAIDEEESSSAVVSFHYEPPGGDITTGVSGQYHYKLAVLRDADADHASPWLEMFLTGSHLSHFRDLPMMENTNVSGGSNVGRIFKKYDPASNQYKFRTIGRQGGQMQVKETDDGVDVQGNEKTADLIFMQATDASPTEIARWSFADGFSTEGSNKTITLPKSPAEGDDFNLENWPCSQDIESPPSSPNWVIYFRKGLAYTTDPEDAVTAKKVMYDGFSCAPPDGP